MNYNPFLDESPMHIDAIRCSRSVRIFTDILYTVFEKVLNLIRSNAKPYN